MALTEQQIQRIRDEVGDTPPDAELEDIYDRDDVEDEWDVIRIVLKRRLAKLSAQPASLTVPGEYGHNTTENIRALQDQLAKIGSTGSGNNGSPHSVRFHVPDDPRPVR